MFERFRTLWSWDPAKEEQIYEGFINKVKERFRELTMRLREKATKKAVAAGEDIDPKNFKQFDIIRNYPPDLMPANIWHDMCSAWNTEEWLNKSKSGSSNRNSAGSNDRSSRHTGGSMGFSEHRANFRRKHNRDPNFKELFLITHLTKECKEKLEAGEISIYDLESLVFVTNKSKDAYGKYLSRMQDAHGSEITEVPDDAELWARVQGELDRGKGSTTRVYGVGSSDLHYIVTGTPSSSSGCATSYADYKRSQEEARMLRRQMLEFEATLENERNAREDLRARLEIEKKAREDLKTHLEVEKKAREDLQENINNTVKKQLEEFMKSFRASGN